MLLFRFFFSQYPPAQNQYMQEKILGELIFPRLHAGPVFALARIQEKIFLRSHFLRVSQILEGNYFGAYTCRACICTRANTGKYSWGIIYVLVSCQGVFLRSFKGIRGRVPGVIFFLFFLRNFGAWGFGSL